MMSLTDTGDSRQQRFPDDVGPCLRAAAQGSK
jgi:hypothetical protein